MKIVIDKNFFKTFCAKTTVRFWEILYTSDTRTKWLKSTGANKICKEQNRFITVIKNNTIAYMSNSVDTYFASGKLIKMLIIK